MALRNVTRAMLGIIGKESFAGRGRTEKNNDKENKRLVSRPVGERKEHGHLPHAEGGKEAAAAD